MCHVIVAVCECKYYLCHIIFMCPRNAVLTVEIIQQSLIGDSTIAWHSAIILLVNRIQKVC